MTIYAETCFMVKEPTESLLESSAVRNLASMAPRLNELDTDVRYIITIKHTIGYEHNIHNSNYQYPKLITRMKISREDE